MLNPMPGDSVNIYELLRILVRATPINTVPGATEADCLRGIDAMESVGLFGELSNMAAGRANQKTIELREKEAEDVKRKDVRPVRRGFQ